MTEVALVLAVLAVGVAVCRWVCRLVPGLGDVVPWLVGVLLVTVTATAFLDRPLGSGTDEVIYHDQARTVRLSLLLTGGYDSDYLDLTGGKSGWPSILGTAYYLTGDDNPYLGLAINAVGTFLALLLVAAAGQRIWGARAWNPWLGAFLVASPAVLLLGPTLLRESWAWLSVAVVLHGVLSLVGGRFWAGCTVALLGIALAFWMRAPLAGILLGATLAALVVSWLWQRFGGTAALASVVVGAFAGQGAVVLVLEYFGYGPEVLTVTRDYLADSSTTGFPPPDPFTPVGLVVSLVRVGLGPLPWEYRPAPVWLWVLMNSVYWLAVLVLAVLAVRRSGTNRATVAVAAFSLVLLTGLAIALTNYGIVVRIRATLVVAVLPLVWGLLPAARRATAEPQTPVPDDAAPA